MTRVELIEKLADAEHAGWAHWMDYLFSVSTPNSEGSVVISAGNADRWRRQVDTHYADLSEREKQSDRDEVAHILPLIDAYVAAQASTKPTVPPEALRSEDVDDQKPRGRLRLRGAITPSDFIDMG